MFERIHGIYFSPTGGTKRIIEHAAKTLSDLSGLPVEMHSYTLPRERQNRYSFSEKDIVIWGTPVYAGRIPNKTLEYVKAALWGNNTIALPILVYGNRSYGQAPDECYTILEENGFRTKACAAIVSRHVFSEKIAGSRPDREDMKVLTAFCSIFAENVSGCMNASEEYLLSKRRENESLIERNTEPLAALCGEKELSYYTPLKENGQPARFLKAKPVCDEKKCKACGNCAAVCPMGSISISEKAVFDGICIKCQACLLQCDQKAISFQDEDFLSHVKMLEERFSKRNENHFWI